MVGAVRGYKCVAREAMKLTTPILSQSSVARGLGLAACGCAAAAMVRLARQRSTSAMTLHSHLFHPSMVDEETAAASKATIEAELANPTSHLAPLEKRERRFNQYMALHVATLGEGQPKRRVDRTVKHKSSSTPVRVSIFMPSSKPIRGVYLHMHGGSWLLGGAAWQNDVRFLPLAERLGMAIVSVDYRLAPEHQFPANVDDCVAASAWLVENAQAEFGTRRLIIGGESAGGHLCALTMLRLRAALGLAPTDPFPYRAANLVCTPAGLDPPTLGFPHCSFARAASLLAYSPKGRWFETRLQTAFTT